jgi:ATP-dependent Lon protease
VKPGVAVTGEVSLHGKVTAVGAAAQKAAAAFKANREILILPRDNAADLSAVPDSVLSKLELVPVDRIEDVLAAALCAAPDGRA